MGKGPISAMVRRVAHAIVPPSVLKYQIALRNYYRGEAEIHLLDSLVDPSRTAADVGAYLGTYTFFLARRCRHVHAFEPQVACVKFLQSAYRKRVTVHHCALADCTGSAVIRDQGQSAHIVAEYHSGEVVPVKSLDEFAFTDLGFLKIDAEGTERRIVEGAEQTIERCKPTMLIEAEERHGEQDIYEIFRYIADLGYRGFYYHEDRLKDLRTFSVEALQRARLAGDTMQPYINNFIFRPK